MTVRSNLNEIRQALANLSALHAGGTLTRADMIAAVCLVETNCAEIEDAAPPAPQFGITTLPIMKLCDVAAQMRAAAAARTEGDAA
jgi:hypothetical protein